ncbi:hypothetical protein C8Q77DRAFT_435412 [Trametes polyzona]|nr:hypothetical protein C8Q77DRAFT_435412 [Trametes polyzona]
MYTTPVRRGHHRKRLSALRLSSDSTVTTLPVYTSPSRQRLPDLPDIPSDQPPAYPDSAEEADEDTDASDDDLFIPSPPPSLPVSPRPAAARRSRLSRTHRRQQSLASASDPYLDSLLERSVHALEMSNALLQSSMSTQSSLSAVLSDDAAADRSLEQRAQELTSRIHSNRNLHQSWMDDLDEISRGVEGLVREEDEGDREEPQEISGLPLQRDRARLQEPISQSLPTGGLEERVPRRQSRRRASQDFRQNTGSGSGSSLQLSAHDRSAFVAPPPRAITMYIDSSEAADAIALPATLGVRPAARPLPTPLPSQSSLSSAASKPEPPPPEEQPRRVVDMLASFVMPRSAPSASSSPSSSFIRRRDSSSSSSRTAKRSRASKSPPPTLQLDTPGGTSSSLRSRSITPIHGSPATRQPRPLTPPIEELSTSSTSSDSTTLHVDRTVESLRQILEKQRAASTSKGSTSPAAPPPLPRPSLLLPPAVAPISGTSTATASVSRLFTKGRHTSSTRPPSPPRQSSMKGRSAPSTPVSATTPALPPPPVPPVPSRPSSRLSVPDVFGGMLGGRPRSGASSGASTPKRISFAEPPEPYSSSRAPGEGSGRSKDRGRRTGKRSSSKTKGKGKGKGKAKGSSDADGDESDGEKVGWWTGWLLGAAGTGSASGLSMGVGRARSEERFAYPVGRGAGVGPGLGSAWAMRPGFGSGLEEWGA